MNDCQHQNSIRTIYKNGCGQPVCPDCGLNYPDSDEPQKVDLPEYLVFLILANVRELKRLRPDHILVKAVEDAINEREPEQLEFQF